MEEELKLIFLDIDGVLNVIGQGHDDHGQIFHQHLMDNLYDIIDATGAKLVISSSWRKSGLSAMRKMWSDRGYKGEIIDVTPSLSLKRGGCIEFFNGKLEHHPTERVYGYSIPRGCEIEYWLRDATTKYVIKSYVILDDYDDMLLSHKDKFVLCSGNYDHEDCVDAGYGLTKICAAKAIEILNKNDK
jgi:hypothetical protein